MTGHLCPRSLLTALPFLLALQPAQATDFKAWTDTIDIFLDTSPSGVDLETRVVDFPLLVRLGAQDFPFARARGKGQDIRFSNSAGVPLPHHIERWDSAGRRAEIWVLVDTVRAGSATQYLRLYSGNPMAPDASDARAVFSPARGHLAVWHMGTPGSAPRPDATGNGNAATPVGYEGDEARPGVIGLADSLDGSGDYLEAGSGFSDFTRGFTYSAWVKPTATTTWGRLMDFGNGEASHNIIVGRDGTSDNLAIHLYPGVGATHSRLRTGPFLTLNQWQHVAVTISSGDNLARAYRNGNLVWTGNLTAPIPDVNRTLNWLGRSHWTADQYWQGLFDEVRVSNAVEDSARIRLSYESQREGQVLTSYLRRTGCQERFAAPADTVVTESSFLELAGIADCASAFEWSVVAGLPVRIQDPLAKTLALAVPRVVGDTAIILRFSATFPRLTRQGQVTVRILEAVPEPHFTLPDSLIWNGRDSLAITPVFTNLDKVKASRDSLLHFSWRVTGAALDTVWRGPSLVVRGPVGGGTAGIDLCVHNLGPSTCRKANLVIRGSSALHPRMPSTRAVTQGTGDPHRLDGRRILRQPPGSPGRVFRH